MESLRENTSGKRNVRWRRREPSQIELTDGKKKRTYDVWAALAEALLVYMVSFGAVGGFLDAYGIKYNLMTCVFGIFGLSLLLSFIYETGKRWFTNLCVIGIFIVYAYVAVKRFWILNSGAYAVINEMYEAAQAYLGITGAGLYNLQVDDAYLTITAIALFVGFVIAILMVIRLQYKASLARTVLMTFPIYLVPIYFDKTPSAVYLFLLLSGYVTLGILQCGKVKKHVAAQIRQALPVGMAVSGVVVLLFMIFLPRARFRSVIPKNPIKESTEVTAVTYAQYGLMAMFMNNAAGGGISEGELSQNSMLMPDNETDLVVRFTPYSMEPTYLQAFVGVDYNGKRWSSLTESGVADEILDRVRDGRKALYEQNPNLQPRGVMEVFNLRAKSYAYDPYYTDMREVQQLSGDELIPDSKYGARYVYYPKVNDESVPGLGGEKVSDRFLTVPVNCHNAVVNACKDAGLSGTPEEIAEQLKDYFAREFRYTLRPGYYFGGLDYVSYFLSKNKKGYCSHFASAGTMMLRNMGIPARYVEGYVFTYTDVVNDGKLLEDISYEEYYDGYSPLGDTALVELEIPDAHGHAWIEMFVEGKGWIVVEVTPAALADEEEETGGFWEAFLGAGGQQGNQDEQGQQAIARYVENALAGGAGILGLVILAVAAFFLIRRLMQAYHESKLSGKERVRLEYGRLTKYLKDRDEGFCKLTTPKEELDWMAERYGVILPEKLREELYLTFFAPETERDYEALRVQVTEVRKAVRKAKRR
ncbi:MAG: DUF3488 and transglutaminase-like domain-containing protein [Acetatifactor sp.]|nr:DUF3488 and transglutaminase-like domain-containing protein [Acetatifactor sp.]